MSAVRASRFGSWGRLIVVCLLAACDVTTDTIGHDNAAATASAMPSSMPTSMPSSMPTSTPSSMPTTTPTSVPTDMPPDMPPPEKPSLTALTGPQEYPNPFHDVLGKTYDEIDKHVKDAFEQLFHGKDDETIYYPLGDDAATIRDIYHSGESRSEGFGLAMLIAVELGKQDEFDRLWTQAKKPYRMGEKNTGLRYDSGPNEGYFTSNCDTPEGSASCIDPYGMEQFAMALVFAHDLWGDSGRIDYEADALDLLNVMKNKEELNGGVVEGVLGFFDAETHLTFDEPKLEVAVQTRPSVLMPAYYALWAEATGDDFWLQGADASRDFFPAVADTKTGLMPLRAYFDGRPVPDSDTFTPETYRVFLNIVLDEIWLHGNPSGVPACNKILSFFSDVGIDKYVGNYSLDGKPLSTGREYALVVANGVAAAISKNADRKDYIQAVWDQDLPTGNNRYYTGILQLFALLVLSGKMQVL